MLHTENSRNLNQYFCHLQTFALLLSLMMPAFFFFFSLVQSKTANLSSVIIWNKSYLSAIFPWAGKVFPLTTFMNEIDNAAFQTSVCLNSGVILFQMKIKCILEGKIIKRIFLFLCSDYFICTWEIRNANLQSFTIGRKSPNLQWSQQINFQIAGDI